MKKFLGRFPWFYGLFTFYPLLYLWSANISQIQPEAVIRPFLFTLAGSLVLYGILFLLFRDLSKAGLIGTILLMAFFSYGHVYYGTRAIAGLKILNHHTVLVPLYVIVFGLLIWLGLRLKKYGKIAFVLNWMCLALVALQVVGLSYAYIRSASAVRRPVKVQSGLVLKTAPKDLPDIYVIILDTYMRSDALKQDLGYDNTPFIDELTRLGFYVPLCSHPNYTFTYASISALLNMRYIPNAYTNDVADEFTKLGYWSILQNDEVRQQLKSIGYKTVAFQEEYPLLEFTDSDVLIGTNHPTIKTSFLYPFEVLYKQTTAAILLNALDPSGKLASYFSSPSNNSNADSVAVAGLSGRNKDLTAIHINSTLFTLNHMSDLPAIAGPKFTYVHLFIPHYPYIFSPDGQILTDPGYYSGDRGSATTDAYENIGYVNQVQYINSRIVPILQTLINKSKNPPIILLMGDHGLKNENRRTNFMAYYLPNNGNEKLYPTISPVNSFRLVFNTYFGGNYPLLPDETYVDDTVTAPDPFPNCAP